MLLPETFSEADSDASLVCAASRGDEAAFTELFRRHYKMIYSYAYRLCLRRTDAEDIAQDTFIKAARSLPRYRPEAPFTNWLLRICTNTARDWAKRHAQRASMCQPLSSDDTVALSTQPTHDSGVEQIEEALSALSPEIRAAIVLVYLEGMNHREAAAVLGCAESTVSWRVFRGKRKLRTLINPHE